MGISRLAAASRWTIPATIVGVIVCLSSAQALSAEVEFDLGFRDPLNKTELSWMARPGATNYQLLRSTLLDFSMDCATFEMRDLHQEDATEPMSGNGLYYLVRALTPVPGSWGLDSDDSLRAVACLGSAGALVGSSGCVSLRDTGRSNRNRLSEDCIEYEYLGDGRLLLNHLNTAFNCCPVFVAGIVVDEDTITVTEDEISGDCDCTCLFDLSYEIVNLEFGIYQVTVNQEYLYGDDEPLDFTMNLFWSPSGLHCVERDHYPW